MKSSRTLVFRVLIIVLLSSLVSSYQSSNATVVSRGDPLEVIFLRAKDVRRVRITKIVDLTYSEGSAQGRCGANYFAEVVRTYKGEPVSSLSFSVNRSPLFIDKGQLEGIDLRSGVEFDKVAKQVPGYVVREGDELVVFLTSRKLTEEAYRHFVSSDVVVRKKSRPERSACLTQLSSNTPMTGRESAFLLVKREVAPRGFSGSWLLLDASQTKLPGSVGAEDIDACIYMAGRCLASNSAQLVRLEAIERLLDGWARSSGRR